MQAALDVGREVVESIKPVDVRPAIIVGIIVGIIVALIIVVILGNLVRTSTPPLVDAQGYLVDVDGKRILNKEGQPQKPLSKPVLYAGAVVGGLVAGAVVGGLLYQVMFMLKNPKYAAVGEARKMVFGKGP